MPDIQASHLTDIELARNAEFYLIRNGTLPQTYQEELARRFRVIVEERSAVTH